MKQIKASVFFDIFSYTIGSIIFCVFKFNNYSFFGLPKLTFFLVFSNFTIKWYFYYLYSKFIIFRVVLLFIQ